VLAVAALADLISRRNGSCIAIHSGSVCVASRDPLFLWDASLGEQLNVGGLSRKLGFGMPNQAEAEVRRMDITAHLPTLSHAQEDPMTSPSAGNKGELRGQDKMRHSPFYRMKILFHLIKCFAEIQFSCGLRPISRFPESFIESHP